MQRVYLKKTPLTSYWHSSILSAKVRKEVIIMSIIKYIPRWIDDVDEDSWFSGHQNGLKVRETDKDIIATAVVAGIPSEDVEVNIENGVLTIKAETKKEESSKDEYRSSSYQYYYTTALSGGDWHKAEAEVKNGILTVTIPKAEASKPKKIAVKAK